MPHYLISILNVTECLKEEGKKQLQGAFKKGS